MVKIRPKEEWERGDDLLPANRGEMEGSVSVPVVPGEGGPGEALYPTQPGFVVNLFPLEEIKRLPRNQKHGFAASLPMICKKQNCAFYTVCPYHNKIDEMKERCVVEMEYVIEAVVRYMENLKVDAEDLPNMVYIKELVYLDIKMERLRKWSQINPGEDFMDVVTSFGEDGREASHTQAHPVHDLMDKTLRARDRILDQMMGTKKSRKATRTLSVSGSTLAQQKFMEARAKKIEESNKE
jgi:hypothetical protein